MAIVGPWEKRSKELEATEGVYADYAAWCEWFWSFASEATENTTLYIDFSECDKVLLYSAFCKAVQWSSVVEE